MKNVSRIEWIDTVRGLAILGVIVFHTGFLPFIKVTDPLLMSWMLPVFVFTGGWLLKNTPFTRQRLLSTARRLLIPFFIAGIVSFLGWLVLRNIYPEHILEQPIGKELIKWLTGRNAYFNSPLWFIPTYFFASLVMQRISRTWFGLTLRIQVLFSILTVTAGLILTTPFQYPVYSYDLIFLFIGMMMIGSVASRIRFPNWTRRFVIDALVVLLFIAISLSNGYIDLFQRQLGNRFLFLVSAVLGSYSFVRGLSYTLRGQKRIMHAMSTIGQHSMDLMAWHWPIFQWLTYGLFTSGLLKDITSQYSKTSFVLGAGWGQIPILQILICLIYSGVTVYGIITIKKILYPK